jgi:hypothetical protein
MKKKQNTNPNIYDIGTITYFDNTHRPTPKIESYLETDLENLLKDPNRNLDKLITILVENEKRNIGSKY